MNYDLLESGETIVECHRYDTNAIETILTGTYIGPLADWRWFLAHRQAASGGKGSALELDVKGHGASPNLDG